MSSFQAYLVQASEDQQSPVHQPAVGLVTTLTEDQLPAGEVTIDVRYSSVNYKDALAATGHPGVARQLPHVPGIDAAGIVRSSTDSRFSPGEEVIVTGYELGSGRWGGWSERIRVPADWVVPKPESLSLWECMSLGTAGFTAAQCVMAIKRCEIAPSAGEILVTGATGGVGSLAVRLLARLGYSVVASTGKREQSETLLRWGAQRVIDRSEVDSDSPRPLLSSRWSAAVDTVGGTTLSTILREIAPYGCVAACGLVAGAEINLTVHPFLLRGISLVGIASALCPYPRRLSIWEHLATDWKPDNLAEITSTISLCEVDQAVKKILAGQIVGRTVIEMQT